MQLQEPRDLLQQQRREEGQEREEGEGRLGEFVFIGKNKREGLKVKIYTCTLACHVSEECPRGWYGPMVHRLPG
jgi:hypothetical protein